MSRVLAWVDGANSAVMTKLELARDPNVVPVHVDLGDSTDEDSHRFVDDLERWYGKSIIRIRSNEYRTIDDVFEKRKYLSGPNGAPCTGALKFAPRLDFQLPSDTHLWGYTADYLDVERAKNMATTYAELKQRSPLIERGITKAGCHAILANAGIRRPRVYDYGFPNGNCIGCVKASSPDYWALVRARFPEVFARRADQSRRFGAKLAIIGREKDADGKVHNIRAFIDDIPADHPIRKPDVPACDFLCHIAEQDLSA